MDINKKISESLQISLSKMGIDVNINDIIVDKPKDSTKGDYSTNIAMRIAPKFQKKPFDLAEEIVLNIEKDTNIEKIEVAMPGFINFFLSDRYLLNELKNIINLEDSYFRSNEKSSQKIVIEYTDANPFKMMHTGHLYTNIVGESFARLQETLGADVKRATYQGDVGLHVAKTMWGLELKLKDENKSFNDIEKLELNERVRYLGEAYMLGTEAYDESDNDDVKKDIDDINYYIFSLSIPSLEKRDFSKYESVNMKEKYEKGRQWCLDYFEEIYKKLGTKFDYYFLESEVGEAGLKLVLDNVGKVFKRDDGAVIYEGDPKKNLHTRVFVNKYGLPTYEAKEIGLAYKKYSTIKYDSSIILTGKEQVGYFRVVLDALKKMNPEIAEGIIHISHGLIKTPNGEKMSSRKGGFVSAEWLIDETVKRIEKLMKGNRFDEDLIPEISRKVAIGAIKYAFLKVGVGSDIVFDFEKSITFDGDTGPYLMYVYSRCNSLLGNEGSYNFSNLQEEDVIDNPYTRELIKCISTYKGVLLDSSYNYAPSQLCQYLFDLGQKFNAFYQNVRIVDSTEEDKKILLPLVKSVMIVMKNGLDHLGIEVVDEM